MGFDGGLVVEADAVDPALLIYVSDDAGVFQYYDRYFVSSFRSRSNVPGRPVTQFEWGLEGQTVPNEGPISSVELPLTPLNLADFGSNALYVGCGGTCVASQQFLLVGRVETMSVPALPRGSAIWFGAAWLGLALARRRAVRRVRS